MKKTIIILVMVLLLSGCAQITRQPSKKEEQSEQTSKQTLNHSAEQENIDYLPAEIIVSEKGCIYKNTKCNYEITFPLEWDGWFNVYEFDSYDGKGKSAEIWFMAKSDAYSLGHKIPGYPMGLPMFDIVNRYVKENSTLDSVIYLGETGNDSFFSATGTSSPFGVQIYPDGTKLAQSEEKEFDILLNKSDLTQDELLKLDRLKIRDMSKDIRNILSSWTYVK